MSAFLLRNLWRGGTGRQTGAVKNKIPLVSLSTSSDNLFAHSFIWLRTVICFFDFNWLSENVICSFFYISVFLKGLWRWHLRKPHLLTWCICATRSQVVPPPKLWITTPVTYSMLSVEDSADKSEWLWHFFHADSTKSYTGCSLPFSLQVLIK